MTMLRGESEILIARPQRWDVPFGDMMSESDVERLLNVPPFAQMDPADFPASLSLRGILANDARIVNFQHGDLIVREGDYGHSAFLILDGRVRVVLESLSADVLGRSRSARPTWLAALKQIWRNSQRAEVRSNAGGNFAQDKTAVGTRDGTDPVRIFLQDVPRVLQETKTVCLSAGEIFGELAALSRTPRTATVLAEGDAGLLEIRWQGLRDLMRCTTALREHVDRLYRENSLRVHLRESPLLKELPMASVERIARATVFESYGSFDWNADFASYSSRDPVAQLAREPVIAEEGKSPSGLLLVRSGFARLSHRYGSGHRTVAYLGKGKVFGMAELAASRQSGHPVPLRHSLRAVGYVDILRIPTDVVHADILPHVPAERIVHFEPYREKVDDPARQKPNHSAIPIDPRMLDFLVDHRLVNGTQTMLINLDRCTRCDDCVRACAATHDNNPRFIRHGPKHDQWMIANACMHCVDPVCMIGCPTGAIARDASTGHVRINDTTCIGCATCAKSCPYDAIRMVEIRDASSAFYIDEATQQPVLKATKCDLCADSLTAPACQNACPHDALVRTDMGDLPALASWLGR